MKNIKENRSQEKPVKVSPKKPDPDADNDLDEYLKFEA